MTTGKRNLLIAAVAVLLILGGGIYYLTANLNGIVAGLIETEGSAATQTPVRVSGVDIRLREASASIAGLSIGNPDGFGGNAIDLGAFSLTLDPASLTADTIVITDITVSGARLNVFQQGGTNNLKVLLDNLKQLQSGGESADSEGGKKLIIDRFTIEGARASISLPELDELREVELPTIVVRDIGRASNGATAAQVARQVLRPVIDKALASAAADSLKDRVGEKLGGAVKGLLDGLGGGSDEVPER